VRVTSEPVPTPLPTGAVDADAFRRALGRFATGITVVTTVADGVDHAMTANSFTSVSLDPPLVLVCVERVTRFHDAVRTSGVWAVSVLADDDAETSTWFASRGRPLEHQLDRVPHVRGVRSGAALLSRALATVECRTEAVYDGGDHSIVTGRVVGVSTPHPDGRPLVYYTGRYHGLGGRA
jgi:flavin reductase (DIM6/NTAB) family NADH-FMN oxidoreductase RutF